MACARHKQSAHVTLPRMTRYSLVAAPEGKADFPDPAMPPQDEAPAGLDDAEPHEWAGDIYDLGDETDPKDSYGSFTGMEGEFAWLDRANDGTLTGWVRDADGTVYRYQDADAWGVDVDDAGMTMAHGPDMAPATEGELMDGEEDPDAVDGDEVDPLADGEEPVDGEEEPLEDDEPDDEADEPADDEPADEDEDEDEDDNPFVKKVKTEGKSLSITYSSKVAR